MAAYTMLFEGGRTKCLTFSYDDGVIQDRRLVEVLNHYKLSGTFNLISGQLSGESSHSGRQRIEREEAAALYAGHEIASHTVHHPDLTKLPLEEAAYEVSEDMEALSSLCGYPVRGMAYPYGASSPELVQMLREMGVAYARTTVSTGAFSIPTDFLTWQPTCHHDDPRTEELAKAFKKTKNLALFYIWGHSYEFDERHNWNHFESLCESLAGDDEIWYATNLQIYDYCVDWQKLRLDQETASIENPTDRDLWAKVGETSICVPHHKTIKLVKIE